MLFCKKCGKKLDSDVVFCPKCGTSVSETKKSRKEQDDTQDAYKTQMRGKPQIYGVLSLENLPEGHIIDERYEIKEKLGQGGFGAVYLVNDKNMNIDKALKIIPEAIINDKEAMFDLQNEAQTMIALNHPNIVRVYDFHKTGSIKFIDMEYIDGKTLTEIKLEHKSKQIPEEKVKELAVQIASGMSYAHQNGILHKDIKPQNVMVAKDSKVKIMDFGIAETVRTSMSRIQNSTSSGTLVYMSPEQIKGKDVGKESDIYSFGVVLYELLSGHPPFYKGDINYQILNEKPEPLENVSGTMNDLLMKCLKKDYKDRFKDFGEIIEFFGEKIKQYSPISVSKKQTTASASKLKTLTKVSIITEPANSNLIIDMKKFKTPFEQKLTTGSHKIEISKEGYKTINDEITISESSTNDFYIELVTVMGTITIESESEGIPIYLNNEKTEFVTPHTFENIIPGRKYSFQIKEENYFSLNKEIIISEKENKTLTLKSVLGSITIESEKEGIPIYLNNEKTEFVTPHTLENIIPNKVYEIYLKLNLRNSETKSIKIEPNKYKKTFFYESELKFIIPENIVYIKGGRFQRKYHGLFKASKILVQVNSFYIGKYLVTQQEWENLMGSNPSHNKGDDLPVESVTWFDTVVFCNKKSSKENLTSCYTINGENVTCNWNASGYRLPTEAEWEYVTRRGIKSKGYKYSGSNNIKDVAWYYSNSRDITHPVGMKQPNEFGIYDMTGNVCEWCWDWYSSKCNNKELQNDPKGPNFGKDRVLRGGSWRSDPYLCHCTMRFYNNPTTTNNQSGFRICMTAK
jgi:serine/threonine protein kinase